MKQLEIKQFTLSDVVDTQKGQKAEVHGNEMLGVLLMFWFFK